MGVLDEGNGEGDREMGVEERKDEEDEEEEEHGEQIKNHLRDEPGYSEEEMENHDYNEIGSYLGDDLTHSEAETGSVGSHDCEESADGDDEMSGSYLSDELANSEVETESPVSGEVEDIEESLQVDMNNKTESVHLDQAEVTTVHHYTNSDTRHFIIPEILVTMTEDQTLETTPHHYKETSVQHAKVAKVEQRTSTFDIPPELTDIPSDIINGPRSEPDLDPSPPPKVDTSMGVTLVDRGEVSSVIEVAGVAKVEVVREAEVDVGMDEEVDEELPVDGIVNVDEANASMERWWRERGTSMWRGGVGIGFSGWRKM